MPRVKRNDKRDRLVEAADELIYEQTFHITTLADIAKKADVPLGNVYYYFKTKDAIMEAVLQRRTAQWNELFSSWEQLDNIKERLNALIQHAVGQSETLARYGCIIGSLCQELGKQGGAVATGASKLMHNIISWTTEQFVATGKSAEDATKLAEHLISNIQGVSLLTLTFKEPEYIKRQSQALREWLANVA